MQAALLFLATAAAAAPGNTQLGCNPGPPGNRNLVFADLVKTSLFGQPNITGSQNTTVDSRGWPTQDFSLLFYNEPGGYYYPAADFSGTYTITALGCGVVSIPPGFGGLTVLNQSCPGGNLLAFLGISADGDALRGRGALAFTGTSRGAGAGAGLTNVSLLLPGYPAGTDPDTLHEPYLANIRGRCKTARFIGWAMFGHSAWDTPTPPTPCDWAVRPKPGDPTYVLGGWGILGLGVPYEIIAKVATALGTDVWINMPSTTNETARDEYATNLVTLFDAQLPPGQKLYIEYANECFFGNNQCYPDDEALANTTVLQRNDPYRLNLGLPTPPNASQNLIPHWLPRMYAYNTLRLAQLAAAVVGPARVGRSDTPGVRVVPVLGALGGYAADGLNKLEWLTQAWGPPTASGLATMNIGSYFGAARNVTTDPNVTSAQVLDSMLANIAAASTASPTAYCSQNALSGFAAASAYYGVALHAYEGGPDTSGGKGAGLMALAQACADPRMADAVTNIVGTWQSWTGGLFNYFQLGAQPLEQPWGSYTNLWDLRVPDTPKSRGVDRIVGAPPAPLTAGWPAPLVRHNASLYVGYYSKSGLPLPTPVTYLPLNATLSYLVRFPARCARGTNVTVTLASTLKAGGEPLEVSLGAFMAPVLITTPPSDGTRSDLVAATALVPPLPPAALANGLVTVRLRVPAAGVKYALWYVSVSCA